MLCPSIVRRGSMSHPIWCSFDCTSSVRACLRVTIMRHRTPLTGSREIMHYGVTKGQCGVTVRFLFVVMYRTGDT